MFSAMLVCARLKYELSCIQCSCGVGVQAVLDGTCCPVPEILTTPRQERVSSFFICFIQFLPPSSLCHAHEAAFVGRSRRSCVLADAFGVLNQGDS